MAFRRFPGEVRSTLASTLGMRSTCRRREAAGVSMELCHGRWWKMVEKIIPIYFHTCQVRVVRFYHSCSPPRLAILLRQHLLHHLYIHFHVHCCLAQLFAKLFAIVRAQCAPLDLNLGPSQLSVHRWTSTWDLPSSVCTAGPHSSPSSSPTSELSVHRWTSTWDLPSSVCTAGPQSGTCPAQCAPLDLNGQIECQKRCQIECQIECQKICQIKCHEICQIECQKICQIEC